MPVSGPDELPIALSPGTFARHEEAVSYVEGMVRNRQPIPWRDRFPGASSGAWGILSSGGTISGASGVTLGSGSVDLCDSSGTRYSPTETITVKNAGGSITASGDKIVRLAWTLGEWCVNCP